jgi:hypothetical protein
MFQPHYSDEVDAVGEMPSLLAGDQAFQWKAPALSDERHFVILRELPGCAFETLLDLCDERSGYSEHKQQGPSGA